MTEEQFANCIDLMLAGNREGLQQVYQIYGKYIYIILYDILKNYARVYMSETAPTITDVYNHCEFWYCTVTDKLYRASKNDERNIVVWFEV